MILNTTPADHHVNEEERSIRVIKERTRCQVHTLPYSYYPKNLIAGGVIFAVKSLKNEVGASKLSQTYAPQTLVTGFEAPNYKEIMDLTFGEYVEVPAVNQITNMNESQTIPAIALYPASNPQGGWRLMSLETGRLLHRGRWTKMAITKEIIGCFDELGNTLYQNLYFNQVHPS